MRELYSRYYNNLPIPVKSAIWFAICQFLQKGINLISIPFITRLLPTEEYGIINTFLSWEAVFLIIISVSSSKSIMNICVKNDNYDKVLSSVFGFNIICLIIISVLIKLLNRYIMLIFGLKANLLVFLIICSFFQNMITCRNTRLQYEYKYKEVIVVTIVYTLLNSLGGLAVIYFISRTADAKLFVQMISLSLVGTILFFRTYHASHELFDINIWKYVVTFCVPLLPHYFSETILASSDRIMINNMCSSSDVAIYSVAYSIGSLIGMVTSAINSSFMSYQYHKIKERDYKELARNTNYIITFVAICMGFILLFRKEIVYIFGGDKYADSIGLIAPICLGTFFNYIFQLFARVQEYFEQKHTIVIASVLCALLNIALNLIFINIYGYRAAAYTTFACYFIFCILHYLFYLLACKKYIKTEIYNIKCILAISMTLICCSLIISVIEKYKYIILLLTFISAIIFRKEVIRKINQILLR